MEPRNQNYALRETVLRYLFDLLQRVMSPKLHVVLSRPSTAVM
jgi:hypothetical protein